MLSSKSRQFSQKLSVFLPSKTTGQFLETIFIRTGMLAEQTLCLSPNVDRFIIFRLSYLNNEIKPVDPHKCPSDRPQRLPDDVRKDLKLQSDLVHHLPLCSHFSRIDLEKSKDSPELSINSPFPDYFSDCIKLLC